MNHPPPNPRPAECRIRLLTERDLPFANAVHEAAGWNQTRRDWRRFLAHEPDGCFLAELDGRPAGTATTTRHGDPPTLAWIGMVLVEPGLRRRGVGTALLLHALAWLNQRGVPWIKLDATPAGKAVYDTLGFRAEWSLTRWHRPGLPAPAMATGDRPAEAPCPERLAPHDRGELGPIDTAAFGTHRRQLFDALAAEFPWWICRDESRSLTAFGQLRPGSHASYLGPVVASNPAAGTMMIDHLVRTAGPNPVYWDIPDNNAAARASAHRWGFQPQRTLTRMVLQGSHSDPAAPPLPDRPEWQWALAGPEVG